MPHLLVVSYPFPPAGGVPVRRVLRLLRHLPEHGWRASVVTADRPYDPFHPDDPAALAELPADVAVARPPARAGIERALAAAFRTASGARRGRRAGTAVPDAGAGGEGGDVAGGALRRRLHETLFFPDPKRFWIPGAVRAGRALAVGDPADLVLGIGYPWSDFVVAARLARALGRPYALDFRDAWTLNPRRLWTGPRSRALERRLVEDAAVVTVATDWIRDRMREIHPRAVLETVTNGYDPAELPPADPALDDPGHLVLTYTGTFNDALPPSAFDQSPWWLLQAVARLAPERRRRLRVRLVGRVGDAYRAWIREHGLAEIVACPGPLPHRRALQHQRAADVLLLVVHDSPEAAAILTGKLVEYAGARRPVLALAPEASEAARAVRRLDLGWVEPPQDVAAIATRLDALVAAHEAGALRRETPVAAALSATGQVARWAELLERGCSARAAVSRSAPRTAAPTARG